MKLLRVLAHRADRAPATPAERASLSVPDAVAFVVGIVIGAGIFKTPSLVAQSAGSASLAMLAWLAGGAVSLVGALCYAELASTYPHRGGDYHYLERALGPSVAFLFAWSRMTVIQTGAIAMQAFLIGDYASQILPLGPHSPSLYAVLLTGALTLANIAGLRQGKRIQNVLAAALVAGLVLVIAVGLALAGPPAAAAAPGRPSAPSAAFGLAMVFVLLTYGGWNEAAYLSADLRGGARSMVRVLVRGIGIVTVIYLAANLAYLRGLGVSGVARSEAVAADLMQRALGPAGATLISVLIVVAALSSMNATMFTGARTNYALGQSFRPLRCLGGWRERAHAPANALLVQGGITLALVLFGTLTRDGFATMVEYTAPVFWFFFLLVGASLLVLRRKEPSAVRPFRVPLYPVTPIAFCLICAHMLRSSLAYTGVGALVGVAALASGVPLLLYWRFRSARRNHGSPRGEDRCSDEPSR